MLFTCLNTVARTASFHRTGRFCGIRLVGPMGVPRVTLVQKDACVSPSRHLRMRPAEGGPPEPTPVRRKSRPFLTVTDSCSDFQECSPHHFPLCAAFRGAGRILSKQVPQSLHDAGSSFWAEDAGRKARVDSLPDPSFSVSQRMSSCSPFLLESP